MIAVPASQAGGIMANCGTMTKPSHAGRAAHAGLVSARRAEAGFSASPDALEHAQGFLSAVSPEGRADRDGPTPGLGAEWQIVKQGLSIKKYPACYCTHRALDGMLELLAKRPLKPAEIGKITVSISETHSLILRNHTPETGLAGKFSMEFAMAAAVIARRASLGEYTDEFVRRPEVQDLMRRVAVPSRVAGPVVAPEEIGAELVEARAADLAHHQVDLAAEDVDRLLDPGQTAGDRAIERRPPEEAELRAEAHRDQDVGAAPDP